MKCPNTMLWKPNVLSSARKSKQNKKRLNRNLGLKWPNGAKKIGFPTNPDLANIFGDTELDFENFYFWDLLGIQLTGFPGSRIFRLFDFQIPKFPDSGLSQR